ncbi:sce7726 family protein [Phycicoccus jejuensis]|uniref:sce7726 family protein n=1 Tax=Phycicoccus jejuensis TaxID=367299 RepID=UPI0006914C7F|nr:sce7726 family protein [Phycicoccus jejuensis]
MRDSDIRSALTLAVARSMGEQRHVLVPEVDIRWSVPARMDAMLVSDRLCAFEIKSDVDSLSRLPRQVQAYGMVAERATLVVGERHLAGASQLVPPWWGIWVARWRDGQVVLTSRRVGRLNREVNPLAVASFLDRRALLAALRGSGTPRLASLSVDDLRQLLIAEMGSSKTLRLARQTLLERTDWRGRSLTAA